MSGLACEKLFFRAVRFLEGVGSVIDEHLQIAFTDWSWGSLEENGTEYAEVYFGCKPKGKRGDFLYVAIVFTENGAWDGHPLWITSYKEDLWNAVKAAFEGQNVVVNEDEWSIGFPWPISSEMSSEDIADRAGAMGKAIAGAFEVTYPS